MVTSFNVPYLFFNLIPVLISSTLSMSTIAFLKFFVPSSVYCWQAFPPTAAAANANALAGWMVNAAASSSVQAAVVTASSLPVPPNQGDSSYLKSSLSRSSILLR